MGTNPYELRLQLFQEAKSICWEEYNSRVSNFNRIRDNNDELKNKYINKIKENFAKTSNLYEEMLAAGIAKECARFILPLATPTRIYMTGSCRSWIHYVNLRSANGTQEEHKQIALSCRKIFKENFPIVSKALDW